MRFRKIWQGSWWRLGELCEVPRCLLWKGSRCHSPTYNVSCIFIFFNKCFYFSYYMLDNFWTSHVCVCVCVFICTHTYAISLRLGNDKEKEVYMATHFNRYILDLIDIYWLPSIHSIFFLHQHCNFLFDNIPHFLETAVQELITSSASSNWGKNVSACLD